MSARKRQRPSIATSLSGPSSTNAEAKKRARNEVAALTESGATVSTNPTSSQGSVATPRTEDTTTATSPADLTSKSQSSGERRKDGFTSVVEGEAGHGEAPFPQGDGEGIPTSMAGTHGLDSDETDIDSDDDLAVVARKKEAGDSLLEAQTSVAVALIRKNRPSGRYASLYNFTPSRPQIREVSGVSFVELTRGNQYKYQQALMHQIIRDKYIKDPDSEVVDVVFVYGGYGAGIIYVRVDVFYKHNYRKYQEQVILTTMEAGGSTMTSNPPPHVVPERSRHLWLLCMSRKAPVDKTRRAAPRKSIKEESTGTETTAETASQPRPLRQCRLRSSAPVPVKATDLGGDGKEKPLRVSRPCKKRVSIGGRRRTRLVASDSSGSDYSEDDLSPAKQSSDCSSARSAPTKLATRRKRRSGDEGGPGRRASVGCAPARESEKAATSPHTRRASLPADLPVSATSKALVVAGAEQSADRLERPKRLTLVDNEHTRRLRAEFQHASVGIKYDDFYDPISGSLLWFSQSCDTSSTITFKIAEGFRNGEDDVYLAAKSAATNFEWRVLCSPTMIRLHSAASLRIRREQMVVKTCRKGCKIGHLRLHLPSPTSTKLIPLCTDVAGRTYTNMVIARDIYDGYEEKEICVQRGTLEGDKMLRERRLIDGNRKSRYAPVDCCIYCAWEPASLWFEIPEDRRAMVETVFHARSAKVGEVQSVPPLKAEENVLTKWLQSV